MIVAIPLAVTSIRVLQESLIELTTKRLAQEWVAQTDYEVTRVDANGNQIDLIINGSGEPPSLPELGSRLENSLNRLIRLNLTVVPTEKEIYDIVPEE